MMGGVCRCYHVFCSILVICEGSLGVAWGWLGWEHWFWPLDGVVVLCSWVEEVKEGVPTLLVE